MSQIINAIYENGVFRPERDVKVKEHERVAIKIVSLDEWQNRFNRIIEKIHRTASHYTSDEIEADIAHALHEVREDKRGY